MLKNNLEQDGRKPCPKIVQTGKGVSYGGKCIGSEEGERQLCPNLVQEGREPCRKLDWTGRGGSHAGACTETCIAE